MLHVRVYDSSCVSDFRGYAFMLIVEKIYSTRPMYIEL